MGIAALVAGQEHEMSASAGTRPETCPPGTYVIDGKYLRRRLLSWAAFEALLFVIMMGTEVFLDKIQRLDLEVMCVIVAVLIAIAAPIRFFAWKQFNLAVTDTEFVLKVRHSPTKLPLSKKKPLVIRRSKSGKYWELSFCVRPGKPIEILFAAFPHLRRFITELGVDTVVFEDSERPDEAAASS